MTTATKPTVRRDRPALNMLLDLVVPLGLYYGLRAAGVGTYLALVIAAVVPAGLVLTRLIRSRRLDGLSLYVLAIMVLSTLVSVIAGSPRVLLAREGWLTGITGLWFIVSIRTRRPLAFLYTRPLLERRTGPRDRRLDWDDLWEAVPRFRRIWRVGSLLWGVGLLADAAVRVVMAYTLPVDAVPALGTVLYSVTALVLIVVTNVYYRLAGLYDPRSSLYPREPEAV